MNDRAPRALPLLKGLERLETVGHHHPHLTLTTLRAFPRRKSFTGERGARRGDDQNAETLKKMGSYGAT